MNKMEGACKQRRSPKKNGNNDDTYTPNQKETSEICWTHKEKGQL